MVTAQALLYPFRTPFIEASRNVLTTMLGWNIEPISMLRLPAFHPQHDVSGIISIANTLRGTIVVSFDAGACYSAAETLIGSRPSSIDNEVMDMIGEITNMIAGSARQQLGLVGINLGLPIVCLGSELRVPVEPGAHVEFLSFSTNSGPMSIQWSIQA
jgi:chemotaxis protein CheX